MLASKHRFHRRNHVSRVYREGKALRGGPISLKYRISTHQEKRFAVVVSKKVSKSAVKRNRIRRRVFESIRRNLDTASDGLNAVVGVFDEAVSTMPSQELDKRIRDLLEKAK